LRPALAKKVDSCSHAAIAYNSREGNLRELREILRELKGQSKKGVLDLRAVVEAIDAIDRRLVAAEKRLPPPKTIKVSSTTLSAGGALGASSSKNG
jgi:hypothetical protein